MKYTLLLLLPLFLFSCKNVETEVHLKLDKSPSQLELFGEGLISTGLYERDIAISPSGDEIVYTLGNYKQSRRCLVSLTKNEKGWGQARILHFSGKYNDIEPFIHPDGSQLFFVSTRPMDKDSTRDDYNIWVSQKTDKGWAHPSPLLAPINSPGPEYYPSVSKSGTLYFTATRKEGIGREDIYRSEFREGKYQNPEVLDTMINGAGFEYNAYINPDEDLLIFGSYGREDDLGGGDLYLSQKDTEGNWTKAIHLDTPFNSEKLDYCPYIDYPRGNFYFTSERSAENNSAIPSVEAFIEAANEPLNGLGNIYRVKFEALPLN